MDISDHLPAQQLMSVHELMTHGHWDFENLGRPDEFYRRDTRYIDNLAADIARRGIQEPVELAENGLIDDGHHRTYGSYLAGKHQVPVTYQGNFDDRLNSAITSYYETRR